MRYEWLLTNTLRVARATETTWVLPGTVFVWGIESDEACFLRVDETGTLWINLDRPNVGDDLPVILGIMDSAPADGSFAILTPVA